MGKELPKDNAVMDDDILTPFAQEIDIEFARIVNERKVAKDTVPLMRFLPDGGIRLTNAFFNLMARAVLTTLRDKGMKLLAINKDGTVGGLRGSGQATWISKLFSRKSQVAGEAKDGKKA